MQGFKSVLEQLSDLEVEAPLIKTYVAGYAACAVTESIVSLQELATPMEQGAYYPLFLICLQQMVSLKDREWLVNMFNESKLDLQNMLPGTSLLFYMDQVLFTVCIDPVLAIIPKICSS